MRALSLCVQREPFYLLQECLQEIPIFLVKSCVSQTLHSLTGRLQLRGSLLEDIGNEKGCAGISIYL